MSGAGGEPLTAVFARLIAATGPISVARYMAESSARYYARRDPLGAAGDFVTAPEISQMFGELIGLWLADLWLRAGRPEPAHYVELGPGRGTLARDALGAAKRAGLTPQVHLVETSPALRASQQALHPDARWHRDLSTLPPGGPLLVVANELLDALPVRQWVRTAAGWRERMVGLAGDRLLFVASGQPIDAKLPAQLRDAPEGAIVETCPAAAAVVGEVAARLATQGGAALFVDYGHVAPRTGSTLQAVRAQRKLDALAAPGEADLTAHVDFAALAAVAQRHGARWLGTVEQGRFLRALGIERRAAALAATSPSQAATIDRATQRLVSADEMGSLFKVMGLAHPGWPEPAGF